VIGRPGGKLNLYACRDYRHTSHKKRNLAAIYRQANSPRAEKNVFNIQATCLCSVHLEIRNAIERLTFWDIDPDAG
jgi:hypothetical protein